MLSEIRTGIIVASDGAVNPARSDRTGALVTTDSHGRYQEAVLRGNVYFLNAKAAAPTAYIGAAAGTPLVALHNPVGSGKNALLIGVGVVQRAAGSAAGVGGIVAWTGISVVPTGTQTVPSNALTQQQSGSSMLGFSNAALTGSTALVVSLPLFTLSSSAAAVGAFGSGWFDVGGLVVAIPGNEIAVGLTAVPTSVTVDISMYWEEVPA